ncbi:MAG: hopanoid biosynthesis-associated protein HpnK [Phascolarctobacterium sp.]|nr:hopanoid biosynthesis-associated protein HpnK [Phascolarctobacterium sp.]
MKKLIVNADDFGLHTLINQGIIKGYREGFITSTSLMTSAPACAEAMELARANPGLGIGIHLTLVGGVAPLLPASEVPSLVDERGLFVSDYVAFAKRFYLGAVKQCELEAELRAQIEMALASGLNITHIDSHQHTHVLPFVNRLVIRLCSEYNIKRIRIPKEGYFFSGGFAAGLGRKIGRAGLSFCADMAAMAADGRGLKHPEHFFGMLAGGHLNAELVGNIIRMLPEGVSEIMTHPGLETAPLKEIFSWGYTWETELASYLDERNKALLQEQGVELINFGQL